MRRLRNWTAVSAIAVVLASCAAPALRLGPRYTVGERRVYRLEAIATTTLDVVGQREVQRSTLVGTSEMEVLSIGGGETTIRLSLKPEGFTLDGKKADLPPEQSAELVLASDGSVARVTSIGGVAADLAGADIEDLTPVIGSPLPADRVRLGERWRRTIAPPPVESPQGQPPAPALGPGQQHGRVAALRVVEGFDCAIVSLLTRRPLVRERTAGEQRLQLAGTEVATTEMAFAFRRGLPVEIRTNAEGRFAIQTGPASSGEVVIVTETTLELLRPSV